MDAAGTFADALARHGGLIDRIARLHEADPARREDLRQEMMVALWRALPAWRQEASLKTLVARVAHNVAVSHVRSAVRQPPAGPIDADLPSSAEPPDAAAVRGDLARRLQAAVAELPLGLRQAVSLYLEDFTHAEIAATLGITETNAAVRINRAKAALQARLGSA